MEQEICRAFEILSYVLVEMPGAPVKQALLDAGIGGDLMRQSYFTIMTKNAKAGEKERFYKVVRETLESIVKNGIDKKALEAALNGIEFREREAVLVGFRHLRRGFTMMMTLILHFYMRNIIVF